MKIKEIIQELKDHIPFAAIATIIAIFVVIFVQYYFQKEIPENYFHLSHFLHLIASGMVTAGIYYKYKPKFIWAFLVGVVGAVVIGGISDIIFPHLGAIILGIESHFHLPLLEETFLTLLSAGIGGLAGIIIKTTKIPHFLHVFLSVFASLFYLLIFSTSFALGYFIQAFFIVLLAVIIPCCVSDIVFPFAFLEKK